MLLSRRGLRLPGAGGQRADCEELSAILNGRPYKSPYTHEEHQSKSLRPQTFIHRLRVRSISGAKIA